MERQPKANPATLSPQVQTRILKMPALAEMTGFQRTTIYNKINPTTRQYDPKFPKPIRLGARSIGWIESEVQAWIDSRIAASRKVA